MENQISKIDILRYYVCFYDIENDICSKIENTEIDKLTRINAFNKYLNHMKIQRNFCPNVAENLLSYMDSEGKNLTVDQLNSNLFKKGFLNSKNSNARVAASKLLWLHNKETIIMDNINKKSLAIKDKEWDKYENYCTLWNEKYQKYKLLINNCANEIYKLLNDKILLEPWFQKRVFDQFLWTIYSNSNK
jgi:hypothetical protein